MFKFQTNCHRSRLRAKTPIFVAALAALACALAPGAIEASAQGVRRPARIQKKIEKQLERQRGNPTKLTPASGARNDASAPNQPDASAPNATAPRAEKHSLDGIRQRGIRSFFTPEEATLIIPGFGQSPAVLLVIFRQLDLTPEQKEQIRGVKRRVGRTLLQTRNELTRLELQLDEAIYGTNDPASLDHYDPQRVEELAAQAAEKRSEMMKLQTGIESQLRQILTPDQFYVFRELLREMLLPARRPGGAQSRQQQLRQRMGIPPNPRNQPRPENPPEKD